ncbi:hypothetical protein [Encephalitozoon cuniculi GB-M1]|uniref:Uncharacterized protein n=2 Tax=Encephalitozoon cuniculi TaxID=6035 RepID=Q8SVL6_ENCCU|nr:uncharacterized protein ECU05_0490 [Encephalitozoon cuniculi GB-M1]AGE95489.1 hypothetical protein ECU05_0490 [Encephalitozoon cuniculi]KMV66104.1 hypothetical protein M970_050450 [Encephalitozoon cuniculi EcunIII-L]UYI27840.1 hypothetical protein J0A71_08g17270 [Encephalitozoon cuniculi]CAD26567.1 hypothetical protein [Encephalitozoon cuniculi GB-M1]
MNNDVLYEVVKYLDFPVRNKKVADAQTSRTNARRMMRLNRSLLEKRLSSRPQINDLRTSNIYREHGINFGKIHRELSDVFCRRGTPPFPNISSALARTVKIMDFKLRKIVLASRMGSKK